MTKAVNLKTLSINDLKPGMFVTTVILNDAKNKVKNQGRVNSQRTIDSLKKQGVTQVIIKCEHDERSCSESVNITHPEENKTYQVDVNDQHPLSSTPPPLH
jgi:hypothetical protein